VIFLRGELGAGKTTLVKGLLAGLGVTEPVTSPTFTLVEQYDIGRGRLFHFDLYRLTSTGDLEMLGIRDMIGADNLCVFEWPERGRGILPTPDLDIDIGFVPEKANKNQDPAQRIADQECRTVKVSPAVSSHLFLDQETTD
jgi:tRNA threonylcarbamoyl adenosine modification protein YjeE